MKNDMARQLALAVIAITAGLTPIAIPMLAATLLTGCAECGPTQYKKLTIYKEDGEIYREWVIIRNLSWYIYDEDENVISFREMQSKRNVEVKIQDNWTFIVEPFVPEKSAVQQKIESKESP